MTSSMIHQSKGNLPQFQYKQEACKFLVSVKKELWIKSFSSVFYWFN